MHLAHISSSAPPDLKAVNTWWVTIQRAAPPASVNSITGSPINSHASQAENLKLSDSGLGNNSALFVELSVL